MERPLKRLVRQDTLVAIQRQVQALPPKEKEVFLLGMAADFSVRN